MPVAEHRPLTKQFSPASLVILPGPEKPIEEISKLLEVTVRDLYLPREQLAYHGWGHITETREWIKDLVTRCRRADVVVDEVVLDHAVLCHDVLFQVPPKYYGFNSKEELAAHHAYNMLREMGAPEAHARKVERVILATHVLADPTTTEEILMRAADVKNVGGDYAEFKANTKRLHEESMHLSADSVSFRDFALRSFRYLSLYAWRYLRLTPEATDTAGRSIWHLNAIGNCVDLFAEVHGGRNNIKVMGQLLERGDTPIINQTGIRANEFFVGVTPEAMVRELTLHGIRQVQDRWSNIAPVFFVPGASGNLPFPSGVCDELHVKAESVSAASAHELLRALRPNGALVVTFKSIDTDGVTEIAAQHGLAPLERTTAGTEVVVTFGPIPPTPPLRG
jgi:hypothetical protein